MNAEGNENDSTPLDYSAEAFRHASLVARIFAAISLAIGSLMCAIGAVVLFVVSFAYPVHMLQNRDLYRSVGFLAVGGMFCFVGMRLKRPVRIRPG